MIAVDVPPGLRELFFPGDLWARLSALGPLTDRLTADTTVAVTSWDSAPIDAETLRKAPRLGLVAHTGATLRPYATDVAWDHGVRFTQAGAAMAHAVAEQALALTLALLHRVHRFDHALRTGVAWEAAKQAPPRRELRDCPVGVIGASRTGRAYIRLVRALGAQVSVTDPYLGPEEAAELGVQVVPLDELLAGSRVVALHAPVLPETRGLLGARELSRLQPGAALVNTARSALVDMPALYQLVRTEHVDAALDVFDEEPLPVDHPLRALPNVLLTPHEAGGTLEARRRAGEIVIAEITRFLGGRVLEHEVTTAAMARMG
ncbi:hydroxyacid dehydrogenase [Hamadaea sp. NPDC050747]|uniref:hydroxyacid dehydrogenase n=1 Tax=Hamadaea sp. NPDC050747 TaxID=3155789 RepID=UPI0033C1DC0E